MHVLLVGPEFEENLSLRYLASALVAAGHTASLSRFDSPEHTDQVVQQALREGPEKAGEDTRKPGGGQHEADRHQSLPRNGNRVQTAISTGE